MFKRKAFQKNLVAIVRSVLIFYILCCDRSVHSEQNEYQSGELLTLNNRSKRSFHQDYAAYADISLDSESLETSSKKAKRKSEDFIENAGTLHLGCFDAWDNFTRTNPEFDVNFTLDKCKNECVKKNKQIIMLRGGECHCVEYDSFNLISTAECNIKCPVTSLEDSAPKVQEYGLCGGNFQLDVYCILSGPGDCEQLQLRYSSQETVTKDLEIMGRNIPGEEFKCASCDPSDCYMHYVSPYYDYFAANTPLDCVTFCTLQKRERPPMLYAITMWDDQIMNPPLPICRCTNDTSKFQTVDDDGYCNDPCPGDSSETCGRKFTQNGKVYVKIYCTYWNSDCGETNTETEPSTTEREPPTTTEPITTDAWSTTMEPTTMEQTETTTSEYSSTIATTYDPTTANTISYSPWPPSTTPNSTNATTVPTTIVTQTTEDPAACSRKCDQTEFNGRRWIVCAGDVGVQDCLNPDAVGSATWKCLDNGQFETLEPDYSGCRNPWLEEIVEDSQLVNDTDTAMEFLDSLDKHFQSVESPPFGHEIRNISMVLEKVVEVASVNATLEQFEKVAKRSVSISEFMISSERSWHQLSNRERSDIATTVIQNIEATSSSLTSKAFLTKDNGTYENPLSLPFAKYFLVTAGATSKSIAGGVNDSLEFPPKNLYTDRASVLTMPEGWKSLIPKDKVEYTGMYLESKLASVMFPGQYQRLGWKEKPAKNEINTHSTVINGQLMSFTVYNDLKISGRVTRSERDKISVTFPGTGVQVKFKHDFEAWGDEHYEIRRKLHSGEKPKAALGTGKCVFWDTKTLKWSTQGCRVIRRDRFETVCECNHLTSFAVLMDVHDYVGKDLGLEILTIFLCALSFICLLICIVIFSTFHGIQNDGTTITKNLAICLLVGNTLVLLVLDRSYFNMNDGFCVASGIVTHYVFMAAFAWMGVEGFHLYRLVVHVFQTEHNHMNKYRMISYGLPLLLIIVTASIGYLIGDRPYGGDIVCWLEGNYIWSFLVPVLVVVIGNLIVLFIALKTACQLQQNTRHKMPDKGSQIKKFRNWIKGCFSLTVLLGLTWLVGFFTLVPKTPGLVAAYCFTILNASQGIFIFLFHCWFNDKVRAMVKRRLGKYLPEWFSSINDQSQGLNAPGSNMKNSTSDSSVFKSSGKFSAHPAGLIDNGTKIHPSRFTSKDNAATPTYPEPFSLRKRDSGGASIGMDCGERAFSLSSLSDSSTPSTDNSLFGLVTEKIRRIR